MNTNRRLVLCAAGLALFFSASAFAEAYQEYLERGPRDTSMDQHAINSQKTRDRVEKIVRSKILPNTDGFNNLNLARIFPKSAKRQS